MCGIVGYIGARDVVPVLTGGLLKLEYRGYDSAGVAFASNGQLKVFKKKGKVQALIDLLDSVSEKNTVGIGHTRWATHGKPSDLNAHPHTDEHKNIAVVHNGIDVYKRQEYGDEHVKTGKLIVYTSADSVFQIAAHEDIVSPEQLYEYCRIARKILTGKHGVGRVIARPFEGVSGNYKRTSRRHDFSLEPPKPTLLDCLKSAGKDVLAVGKIFDIFAGRGTTQHWYTASNADGMSKTDECAQMDFEGLCFVNLVDFDMLYGHRNDVDGYANALTQFDSWLSSFIQKLRPDDILIITADHGCDPGYLKTTDHSREYVPLLVYSDTIKPINLGTREGFCDIAKTLADNFKLKNTSIEGNSFLDEI